MERIDVSAGSVGKGVPLRIATWAAAALGCGCLAFLLRQLGTGDIVAGLRSVAPVLPFLLVLELGRVMCELFGTRAVLGPVAEQLRVGRLLRGQLIGQTLDVVMPAGRASSEAVKAAVFAEDIGLPPAAAAATALQLAALAANALWALTGYGLSSLHGGVAADGGGAALPSALSLGLLGYAGVTGALVVAALLCAASPRVRAVFHRIPFVHATLERFADMIARQPARLLVAAGAQLLGRSCQASQIAVLALALGAHTTLIAAIMGQAVYLVGAAAGDLVPGQLGATDAAFVMAAGALGFRRPDAMAASLALHGVQALAALCAGAGALGLWLWEARTARASCASISEG